MPNKSDYVTGVSEKIKQTNYLRQRSMPDFGDIFYLTLSDLLIALRPHATNEKIRILDFGAGGSPYRFLFPNSIYESADFNSDYSDGYTFLIDGDGRTNAPSSSYDLVISTQAAEHAEFPDTFFSECFRVLKGGGKLICTTHGQWEEHGCPHDYQRWTSSGIERDIKKHGFCAIKIQKTTVGSRALLAQLISGSDYLHGGKKSVLGAFLFCVRVFLGRFRILIHRNADQAFKHLRVVESERGSSALYICLVAAAVKPSEADDCFHE